MTKGKRQVPVGNSQTAGHSVFLVKGAVADRVSIIRIQAEENLAHVGVPGSLRIRFGIVSVHHWAGIPHAAADVEGLLIVHHRRAIRLHILGFGLG